MKKIIVMLFLAIALNAESVSLEKQLECLRHLKKADEFMEAQLDLIKGKSGTGNAISYSFWIRTNAMGQIIANLQERYNICMRNAKIWKQP